MFLFCLVFAMSLCASVYMCFVVTCWERADLLALVCGVYCEFVTFPIGILGQVLYLIVSIPDLCTLTYFDNDWQDLATSAHMAIGEFHCWYDYSRKLRYVDGTYNNNLKYDWFMMMSLDDTVVSFYHVIL